MSDQPTLGSTPAPAQGTGSAPTGTDPQHFQTLIAGYQQQIAQAQTAASEWEKRYGGQQAALQKKVEALNAADAREAELRTQLEEANANLTAQTQDWATRYAALEKLTKEQEGQLKKVELRDNTRSLIQKDFPDLLGSFDNDPVMQAGVLALASTQDAEGLKANLTASVEALKTGQRQAINSTLSGSTPPAPAGGAPAQASIESIQAKIRALNPITQKAERDTLINQLTQLMDAQWDKFK